MIHRKKGGEIHMWKKISNYQYNFKTLKSWIWIFGILFIFYSIDFSVSLIKDQSISYKTGIFAIIFLMGFLDSLYKIKTKNYKTA